MDATQQKKVDPKEIQRLRQETNAGVMDCSCSGCCSMPGAA